VGVADEKPVEVTPAGGPTIPVGIRVDREEPPWRRKVERERAEEEGPRRS